MVEIIETLKLCSFVAGTGADVTNPLYEGIALVGPIALTVVGMLALFYGIFLGVKYAKCEDAAQKANMQKTLVNFWIGAVVIWILIAVLAAIRQPLNAWISR